jgi:hypothetical protein
MSRARASPRLQHRRNHYGRHNPGDQAEHADGQEPVAAPTRLDLSNDRQWLQVRRMQAAVVGYGHGDGPAVTRGVADSNAEVGPGL